MTDRRYFVRYEGPPAMVGWLTQLLREEGVTVEPFERPEEGRGLSDVLHDPYVVTLVVAGAREAIGRAVDKLHRDSRGAGKGTLEGPATDDE